MQFLSHSTQETEAIGEELAQKLRGGDVLAFTGSLGMGRSEEHTSELQSQR